MNHNYSLNSKIKVWVKLVSVAVVIKSAEVGTYRGHAQSAPWLMYYAPDTPKTASFDTV